MIIKRFKNVFAKDLFTLVTDKLVGKGSQREVWTCSLDPTVVLKFEERGFQNVREWSFWQDYQFEKNVSMWLAPCVSISACGTVLVQKRTEPLVKLPEKLPSFMTDIKQSNFGKYQNKVVCHDYGHLITECNHSLKKVKWNPE